MDVFSDSLTFSKESLQLNYKKDTLSFPLKQPNVLNKFCGATYIVLLPPLLFLTEISNVLHCHQEMLVRNT